MHAGGVDFNAILQAQEELLKQTLREVLHEQVAAHQQVQQETHARVVRVMQRLTEENIFTAAQERIAELEETLRQNVEAIALVRTAKTKSQDYLAKLMQINAELQRELVKLKEELKHKPPLGKFQNEFLQLSDPASRKTK